MRSSRFKEFSSILFIIATALLTIIAVPMIQNYNNPDKFNSLIDRFGVFGFIILLFI